MFIFVFFAAVLLFWDPPRNNRDALMPKPNRSQKCSDPGSSWHWSIWPFQHNHHHSYCSPGVLSLRKDSSKLGRKSSLCRVNSLFPVPLGVNQQNVGIENYKSYDSRFWGFLWSTSVYNADRITYFELKLTKGCVIWQNFVCFPKFYPPRIRNNWILPFLTLCHWGQPIEAIVSSRWHLIEADDLSLHCCLWLDWEIC